MAGLGIVDWAFVAVLGVSVLIGALRGLVFEVMSLLGWVVAYVGAQWFAPVVGPHLPVGTPGSALNHAAAFAATFVLVIVLWGLAARLVRMLVSASPLGGVNRVLGAGFGLLRGLVLLLAVATVVNMTPAARSPVWRESVAAGWLDAMLRGLKPVLPPRLAQHLPA